jgi:hypothetical protein
MIYQMTFIDIMLDITALMGKEEATNSPLETALTFLLVM